MTDDDAPVVIVGAGPAGLVLAWLLHRAGVPALVVERHPRDVLARLPKAGIVEHRTVVALRREGVDRTILDFAAENRRCEFRTPESSVVLDYADLTGGRPHYVYPQHLLVERLCTALLDAGGRVLFEHEVGQVSPATDGVEVVLTGLTGDTRTVHARCVVGADGAGSRVARAMTADGDGPRVHERTLPGRWLVVSAASPPLVGHTIYAAHPRGFAGHIRRGPEETRFYLEVPGTESADDWPHDRLRAELAERLGVGAALDDVVLAGVDTLDLRVRVTAPMQRGPLFLVGDAAHLITPAGGKGMNLAIGDAIELAHGLIERHASDPGGTRLAAYSAARLPVVWRAEAFSDWFLRILSARSAGAVADGEAGFVHGVRAGWVSALQHDPALASWFAHAYAGVDAPAG